MVRLAHQRPRPARVRTSGIVCSRDVDDRFHTMGAGRVERSDWPGRQKLDQDLGGYSGVLCCDWGDMQQAPCPP